jgi:hypothetical protein
MVDINFKGTYMDRKEFEFKHGTQFVVENGWLYYPDGTKRENTPAYGVIVEPQSDYEKAQGVLRYWQILLQRAVNKFSDWKALLKTRAEDENIRNPTKDEIQDLRRLHSEVKKLQDICEQAEKQVERTKPVAVVERQSHFDEIRAEGAKIKQILESYEV